MRVIVKPSAKSLARQAADMILDELRQKPDLLLCAATGETPRETYALLADACAQQPALFAQLRLLKLDEWGGVNSSEKGTCESFLQSHLVKPLRIDASRYAGFDSNPKNPQEECARIRLWLQTHGPIDLCVLGLGANGHIAFNEPADSLQPFSHVAELSETSLRHSMTTDIKAPVSYGLTLGMAEILQSRKILMLISGVQKQEITRQFLSGEISTQCPASFLWLHGETTVLCDQAAIVKTDYPSWRPPSPVSWSPPSEDGG